MTLDDAIKNFEQEVGEFEGLKRIHAVTYEDYDYIGKTKQLLEWLKELKTLREQRFDVHNVNPEDKDYPITMKLVPFADKYSLISVEGLIVVPLIQVLDEISSVKADLIRRNGVDCCPKCGKPLYNSTIINVEGDL